MAKAEDLRRFVHRGQDGSEPLGSSRSQERVSGNKVPNLDDSGIRSQRVSRGTIDVEREDIARNLRVKTPITRLMPLPSAARNQVPGPKLGPPQMFEAIPPLRAELAIKNTRKSSQKEDSHRNAWESDLGSESNTSTFSHDIQIKKNQSIDGEPAEVNHPFDAVPDTGNDYDETPLAMNDEHHLQNHAAANSHSQGQCFLEQEEEFDDIEDSESYESGNEAITEDDQTPGSSDMHSMWAQSNLSGMISPGGRRAYQRFRLTVQNELNSNQTATGPAMLGAYSSDDLAEARPTSAGRSYSQTLNRVNDKPASVVEHHKHIRIPEAATQGAVPTEALERIRRSHYQDITQESKNLELQSVPIKLRSEASQNIPLLAEVASRSLSPQTKSGKPTADSLMTLPEHLKETYDAERYTGNNATKPSSDALDDKAIRETKSLTKNSSAASHKRPLDLDYTQEQLSTISYQQLQNESFDHDPRVQSVLLPKEVESDTLAKQLAYISKIKDIAEEERFATHQSFFSSLNIERYEECGDLIVEQLADIITKFKKSRQEKRRIAKEFEDEVSQREEVLGKQAELIDSNMGRLKKAGLDMVRGSSI
ncbi:hypothetical protein MMC19_003724 [Ptychographa xylographoides]|nr:hypothetical protein [Ptychographa xylographoides]